MSTSLFDVRNHIKKFLIAAALPLLFISLPAGSVFATDSAATKPTASASVTDVTSVANAYDSSATTYATWTSSANVATYTTFNISTIPANATIDSVKVTLSGKTSGRQAQVSVSSDGTNFSASQVTTFTNTDSTLNFTGAASKWGLSWTPSSFTNNLLKVKIDADSGGSTFSLGMITVTVTYTVPTTGTIIIVQDSVPNDATDFEFTTTGTGLSSFSLDDDSNATLSNTKTFTTINPGSYTVVQGAVAGWPLSTLVCVDPSTNSTGSVGTLTASINLAAGETVTCTFTNTQFVKANTKTVITSGTSTPSVVGQAYTIGVSVGRFSGTGAQSPSGTVTVTDGTVTSSACSLSGTGATTTASCSLTSTSPGTKNLVATYSGDTNFNTSTSAGALHTVTLAAGPACTLNVGTNLIQNPCLENDTTGAPQFWQYNFFGTIGATETYKADNWNSGTGAAKIVVTTAAVDSGAAWSFDPVTVIADKNYVFTAMYNSNVATEFDVQFTVANANADPTSCTEHLSADGFSDCFSVLANVPSSAGAWQQYTTNIIPPTGATNMTVSQIISAAGTLYVDDYSLTQTNNPNAYAQGMVSLTFDDGWQSFYDNGRSILNTAGLKSTEYIITGVSGSALEGINSNTECATPTSGPAANTGYMKLCEIKQLAADGHEIGAHSRTHPIGGLTASGVNLDSEINGSWTDLSNQGFNITTFAFPEGTTNSTIEAMMPTHFAAARGINGAYNDKITNSYELNAFEVFAATPLAEVEHEVDTAIATKSWLVLFFHKVQADCGTDTECITPANLQLLATYIKNKGVCVPTVAQVIGGSPCNQAPTLDAMNNQIANTGVAFSLTAHATDPDNDTLTYSASPLPVGASINSSTGVFTWTPAANQLGATTTTITVNDGHGGTDSKVLSITVNAAPVATVMVQNKTYDGTTAATITACTLTGILPADEANVTCSFSAATATFDTKDIGTGKTVTVTGLALAGTAAGNYVLPATPVTVTADITAKALTLATPVSHDKTYDGTTDATVDFSLNGVVGTDAVTAAGTPSFADKNAGALKSVNVVSIALSGADAGNYALAETSTTTAASITALAATIGATADTKVFDGTTAATAHLTVSNKIGTDDVTAAYTSATFDTADAGTAKVVTISGITLAGVDAVNYSLANTTATANADITAQSGDIVMSLTTTVSYNGLPQAVTATSEFTLSPVSYLGTGATIYPVSETAPTDAGTYSVSVSITDINHSGSSAGTLTITKVPLTVTAANQSIAFGATPEAFTAQISGFVNAEEATVLDTAPTCDVAVAHTAIGTYDIVCSGGTDNNYDFTYTNGSLNISADPNNAASVADSQSINIVQASTANVTLTATDSTDPADTLTFSIVAWPTHGVLATTSQTVYTYTPAADFYGTDSFTFKVNDGNADSNTATVSITVHPAPICPAGYTSNGTECAPNSTAPVSGCPTGTTFNSETSQCEDTQATSPATPVFSCPEGATLDGENCIPALVPPTAPICAAGTYDTEANQCVDNTTDPVTTAPASCPDGSSLNTTTDQCETPQTPFPATSTLTCPTGYTLDGINCVPTPIAPSAPVCPVNTTDSGLNDGMCVPQPTALACVVGYHMNSETNMCDADHVIHASAGEHGTISPSGDVGVANGTSQSFTFSAELGFHIADVTVDGGSVGAVEHYDGFTNVTADHTISVSFAQDAAPAPAPSGGGCGSCGGGGGGGGGGGFFYNYSVKINDGAATTSSANVTLTISQAGSANQMQISNTPDFAGATWLPFKPSMSWTLSSGSGMKTVYFRYGSASTTVANAQDSIILNDGSPEVQLSQQGAQGQVLGASTFFFSKNLSKGMTNTDVLELQKRLIAEGFLVIDAPTTYYGSMTFAAVQKYQAAHGIETLGNVGPKTRAALNAGGSTISAEKQALIDALKAQLVILMQKIAELIAAGAGSTTATSTIPVIPTGTSTTTVTTSVGTSTATSTQQ